MKNSIRNTDTITFKNAPLYAVIPFQIPVLILLETEALVKWKGTKQRSVVTLYKAQYRSVTCLCMTICAHILQTSVLPSDEQHTTQKVSVAVFRFRGFSRLSVQVKTSK